MTAKGNSFLLKEKINSARRITLRQLSEELIIIPPANEVSGVYSDPYVRPFVRSFVRPSQSLIRYSSMTTEQIFMKRSDIVHYMMPYCTSYFKILGCPRAKQGFCHYDIWGGGPSLIRYSSKTAEQNFTKLLGIVHYMMPYCTSYFKFLSAWFWVVPEQNKDFAITTYGGGTHL